MAGNYIFFSSGQIWTWISELWLCGE